MLSGSTSLTVADLYKESDRPLIGFFPAASDVTGCLNDDLGVTSTLHNVGALALWDYSMVAPVASINMNPLVSNALTFYNCNTISSWTGARR